MMNEILIYSLETAMIFSWLFIPYLFIKNDTLFTRNRFYLIISMVISLVFPLINLDVQVSSTEKPIIVILEQVNISAQNTNFRSEISFFDLSAFVLIFVGLLFFIRLIYSIFKILSLIIQNPNEKNKSETIVWLNEGGDFSFFKFIFLVKEKYHPYIIEHERVHVKRGHSFDILFFELIKCFQWFNPFVWIAARELKVQHEYEADSVVSSVNKNEYQALLLSSVLEVDLVPMTNSFHCLTIKKRFIMMNKKRTSKFAAAKSMIALPFVLLAFGMFALNPNATSITNSIPPIIVGGDEESDVVQPEFNGGMEALVNFLSENLKYPEKAKADNVSGKVYVSFVISKSGKVKDAKVIRGVSTEIDNEALRVIKAMPDWTPGTKDGKKADIEMKLPINFQL
jgi:TonB family protein